MSDVSVVLSGKGICVELSLLQRSLTECGVSVCDREASILRPWPTWGPCTMERKNN